MINLLKTKIIGFIKKYNINIDSIYYYTHKSNEDDIIVIETDDVDHINHYENVVDLVCPFTDELYIHCNCSVCVHLKIMLMIHMIYNKFELYLTPFIKIIMKIFDHIHGYINICKSAKKILDTPEFQRLRNVKQLGCVYYVFPSASHNRFEHSLGVYHLTRLYMDKLNSMGNGVLFDQSEYKLISIAALIHDLGHGPFFSPI